MIEVRSSDHNVASQRNKKETNFLFFFFHRVESLDLMPSFIFIFFFVNNFLDNLIFFYLFFLIPNFLIIVFL
jgi:hypothetical protein